MGEAQIILICKISSKFLNNLYFAVGASINYDFFDTNFISIFVPEGIVKSVK